MKLLKILVLTLMTLVMSSAWSADQRRDGNWWNPHERAFKISFVIGFFDGVSLGNKFSYWKCLPGTTKEEKSCIKTALESFTDYSAKFLDNVTSGQLSDGLDTFYSDYRNRKIKIDNAIWIVLNSIAGMPKNELEQMTESWRASPASN